MAMMPVFSILKMTGAGRKITSLKLAWAKPSLKLCLKKRSTQANNNTKSNIVVDILTTNSFKIKTIDIGSYLYLVFILS